MVTVNPTESDDPRFVGLVERVLDSAARLYRPAEIYILQIDHWFDQKWLAFSGKLLGALGVSKSRLTLPPFHPHRVVSQAFFRAEVSGAANYAPASAPALLVEQRGEANLQRFVDRFSNSGVFVWYSGDTKASDMASVMLYWVVGGEAGGWYASFKRSEGWKLNKVEGISRSELSAMSGPCVSANGI